MSLFIARRLLISIPVLLGVTFLIYLMVDLAPGDPVSAMISPRDAGKYGTEWIERERARLGLDQPLLVRYGIWLGEAVRGNLGYSLISGRPVVEMIAARLGPTLRLTMTALVISTILSVLIGMASAIHQYRPIDHFFSVVSFVTVSIPSFFLGLLLIYVFALRLHWFPTGGISTAGEANTLADALWHLTLPAAVLALSLLGSLARYTRGAIAEVLDEDYVRTARAKGLRRPAVLTTHVLRNGLLPIITITALRIPFLLGGAVVVEQVFAWEGLGQLGIQAVYSQDYPVVMAFNLLIAVVVIISNLLADVAYALADPRIRYN
jgi:peptide/nickel transport system permease protein